MNNKSTPSISVLVAVYNGAKTFQQCIDSVAMQTYPHRELIVIDGGSQDGTVEIYEANREKISYWISEPDGGIYNAWNKGLRKANGDWICFLGADDYFIDDAVLAKMSERLEKIPQSVLIAYAQVLLVNIDGVTLFPVGEPWEKVKKRFLHGLCLPHQGVMHRRCLFERNGRFDESFRIAGDYELMLRELKTGKAEFIPDIVMTAMRQGGLSSHPSSSLKTMRDIRRAQKIHGQYFPSFLWSIALIKVYIRLLLLKLIGEEKAKIFFDFCRRIKGLPEYWTKT